MITWGISANSHDAALSVFDTENGKLDLRFASHSERFSRIKNDPHLCHSLVDYAIKIAGYPDQIVWYEKPLQKSLRQLRSGQGWMFRENNIRQYLKTYELDSVTLKTVGHHHSHAANGYFTSNFDSATIVVLDSIGEWNTASIWTGRGTKLKKRWTQNYPNSLGLWYSSMTDRIGLKANEDEYILMGMAAYGNPYRLYRDIANDFFKKLPDSESPSTVFKQNLHRGCKNWRPDLTTEQDFFDIAAATQQMYEDILDKILEYASKNYSNDNLVLSGGTAMNCVANGQAYKYFKKVHIPIDPTDAGSSIGAVLAKTRTHIDFHRPFVGYNIDRPYSESEIILNLLTDGIVGIANGAAEFGARALGNRSLLADPRQPDIKQKVNNIKQRQQFRPFAPAILEEKFDEYFQGVPSPYMQFTARCRRPDLFPAIVHHDGTSRVQTVSKKDNLKFRSLLERWNRETSCPMLLNTSLNIKGEPMVNSWKDAQEFSKLYNIKVF